MRPSFSIIAFTVLSGAGYGLLFLLGLELVIGSGSPLASLRSVAGDPRCAASVMLAVAFTLTVAGLLASVAHLGQPLRAWRAFSQWKSSWLSREGIAALTTSVIVIAFVATLWSRAPSVVLIGVLGLVLCASCVATVLCTARIYSSLPPIRAWANRHTLPAYLALGLASGSWWYLALNMMPGLRLQSAIAPAVWVAALVLALAAALIKWRYWRWLDAQLPITPARATGLEAHGAVRSLEQPHTEENYLTHEMGFVLARKHSRRLRAMALVAIVLAPLALLPLTALLGWPLAWVCVLVGMCGVGVERWLFFAEAKHAVMAYYAR